MDNGASSYRRYLDGDEDAFALIVNEYFDDLLYFIIRYVRDAAAAEDIAIDVFSDLIVHKHRYDFRWPLRSYLYMVARSRALNYIKRRNILDMVPLAEAESLKAAGPTPEERVLESERKQALWAALDRLPPDQREAVQLVYFSQLSGQDAARIMRKNRKQIYNLLYRAKNALRADLEKEGEHF